MATPLSYICGIAAGYIAPTARLYPPFRRVMFFALWAKSKCVRAVRAHLYKGVTQRWMPALSHICGTPPLKCAAMGGTPQLCRLRWQNITRAKHGHNRAEGAI